MKAKEDAKQKTKDKIQDAMARPAVAPANNADDSEKAVPVVNVKGNEEMEEIPIAGRTKMTVPKKGSQDTLSSEQGSDKAVSEGESDKKTSGDDEEKTKEEKDKLDAKAELNAILKRAPSMLSPHSYSLAAMIPGLWK